MLMWTTITYRYDKRAVKKKGNDLNFEMSMAQDSGVTGVMDLMVVLCNSHVKREK